MASGGQGLQVDSQLVAYLEAHQGSAKYLFATTSSQTAAPYIIATGEPVMTLGGFSGSDQILTLAQLKTLIREGQVKYFLLGGGGFGGGGNSALVQWIEANTSQVPASAYGGSSGTLYVVTSATLSAANF
jgi:4-amino-4-deoxy-L-arabinose transferase-like glycosyltransferase